MARVVWARRSDIQEAIATIPAKTEGSLKDFRPPPTIESDFRRLLAHDVPHVNFTFELVRDWYELGKEGYEPIYLRAQQTPIDWKSKIGNSDMNTNFKVTHDIPIHKGDMVIREDGVIFLLNWNVQNHANNQATQSAECNVEVTFTRECEDEVDENGYLVQEGSERVVVPSIPAVHTEYAGRPDFSAASGQPGMHADHLITVNLQYNAITKGIHMDDKFEIGGFTYRVINISIAEVNIDKEYGVLTLNAKRVAGGVLEDE